MQGLGVELRASDVEVGEALCRLVRVRSKGKVQGLGVELRASDEEVGEALCRLDVAGVPG